MSTRRAADGADGLVCPRDHARLERDGEALVCREGHAYAIAGGVPILLIEEAEPTQLGYWATATEVFPTDELPDPPPGTIDPYVLRLLRGTCGNLYGTLRSLPRYPVPEIPLPAGNGAVFVELGSNWGRWCIAAAALGYNAMGIDPSLGAIRAARRVARQLGVGAEYVVADARHLPLRDASADVIFSYSVLQHLGHDDVEASLAEVTRVLKPGGLSLHQLPNAFGLWNLVKQARRRFRAAEAFDVRYWTPRDLKTVFGRVIGPTHLQADGWFSLNPQRTDLDLLPRRFRPLLRMSAVLRRASVLVPFLVYSADSLYVVSRREMS
jgi:SAM-dependent methyltransferase